MNVENNLGRSLQAQREGNPPNVAAVTQRQRPIVGAAHSRTVSREPNVKSFEQTRGDLCHQQTKS
jgi:hypothetical protein